MRVLAFLIPAEYGGVTVKGYLRGPAGLSARLFTKLKRVPGGLTADGKPVIATDHLPAGAVLRLSLPEDAPYEALPEAAAPVAVLWEDADFLAVDKPANTVLYRRPGHEERDTVMAGVCGYLRERGEPSAFRPLYRLDKDTTGILLTAKNAYCAGVLGGTLQKTYFAVCEGLLKGEGTVDAPIGVRPGHSMERAVLPEGEPAVTHWLALGSGETHTLLACRLETGRTHQIRVHMAHLGHPLAGDDFYGGKRDLVPRQALHCGELNFIHPVTHCPVRLSAAFPADFTRLLQICRINYTENPPHFPSISRDS